MSESQGYKLGMRLGLSDKSALFAKVRRDGSKREVELLMGSGSANTAFRRGLKSAAFELKQGKRRPATRKKTTRKKTTRQRLTTARRPAAKSKSSSRKSSRPKYFSESQVEAWYRKVPRKVGRYEAYDSTTEYTTKEDMTSEERKDIAVWYEIPGTDGAWILSQEYRDSPFVLSANDASERFSGTLAQMKKKLAAISRRKSSSSKRKNPRRNGGHRVPVRGRKDLNRRGLDSSEYAYARPTAKEAEAFLRKRGLTDIRKLGTNTISETLFGNSRPEMRSPPAQIPVWTFLAYDGDEDTTGEYHVFLEQVAPYKGRGKMEPPHITFLMEFDALEQFNPRKRKNPRRRDSMGRFV